MIKPFDSDVFFAASLNVGAILAGFCGTFLSFRIQREAGYFRQPSSTATDNYIGLTHFTASLLLLLLATVCTMLFGIVLPLLLLGGARISIRPGLVVGGLIAGLLLMAAYFVAELVHYRVFKLLDSDKAEWSREWLIVAFGLFGAVVSIWHFGLR